MPLVNLALEQRSQQARQRLSYRYQHHPESSDASETVFAGRAQSHLKHVLVLRLIEKKNAPEPVDTKHFFEYSVSKPLKNCVFLSPQTSQFAVPTSHRTLDDPRQDVV